MKEKKKEYSRRPDVKEKRREYSRRPDVKEKKKENTIKNTVAGLT